MDLLTPKEVAEMLKVSVSTLKQWRKAGYGMPHIKMGRFVRYRREAVERFVGDNERQ